jgi:hypothetical protein
MDVMLASGDCLVVASAEKQRREHDRVNADVDFKSFGGPTACGLD